MTGVAVLAILMQVPQTGPSHPAPRLGPDPIVHYFLSAEPSKTLRHVTVGVSRISIVGASGDRVIFRANPSIQVDLDSLSSGSAYRFISREVIPNGVYDGIRVELDAALTVAPAVNTAPVPAKFTDTKFGFKTLMVEFPAPRRFDSNRNVALQFDLPTWSMKDSRVALQTEIEPESKHVTQLGVEVRDRLSSEEVANQVPVTLSGFVTGPIGRPRGSLIGVRQPGWILPVRFGLRHPTRGNIVRFTGTFPAGDDAFLPTTVEWIKGNPASPPSPALR